MELICWNITGLRSLISVTVLVKVLNDKEAAEAVVGGGRRTVWSLWIVRNMTTPKMMMLKTTVRGQNIAISVPPVLLGGHLQRQKKEHGVGVYVDRRDQEK